MWSAMKYCLCIVLLCLTLENFWLSFAYLRLYRAWIFAPKFIQANRDYTMVISNVLVKNNSEYLVSLRIKGTDWEGRTTLNLTKAVHLKPDTQQMIALKIPSNITDGEYYITIEGNRIDSSFRLEYLSSHLTGLIQLNQPVIIPGDKLKFRVIVVDGDLKPVKSHETTVSVYIRDPHNQVIREWTNISLYSGVFEGQMVISSIPVLGTYLIDARANGRGVASNIFEVRDDDLYSVDLNIVPTVEPLLEHQALNLTITVENYLGKPAKGNVTVRLYHSNDVIAVQTWHVNGIRQVYLPFMKNVNFMYYQEDLMLKVNFTEQYTGRVTTKNKQLIAYYYKYNVDINNLIYQPGSPFKTILRITHNNGEIAKKVTLCIKRVNQRNSRV
ncbi:CD109 antigen-like [Anopheles darlingi]|uniref:CD109 antigen-like n=1 Tax=Anopheles darlingi TaxID=43151 RepID=UPI00210008B1|nr:CD109 antigen-like [Anopheles darlingi]